MFEPHQLGKLMAAIPVIIRDSYRSQGLRQAKEGETRRRVEFLWKTAKELRRECGWATNRIIHELPKALEAFLLGAPWEPDARQVWIPSDGV